MINFRSLYRVGMTSVLRRFLVVCALAFSPIAAVAANGWDVFQSRCLTPMSNDRPAQVDDLQRGGDAIAAEHFDTKKLALMKTYVASEDVTAVVQAKGAADYPGCLVLADDDTARSRWLASDVWLTNALAAGTWEQRGGSILGPHYRNTDVQEPNLRFVRIEITDMARIIFGVSVMDRDDAREDET